MRWKKSEMSEEKMVSGVFEREEGSGEAVSKIDEREE